jgi:hypothetical protein
MIPLPISEKKILSPSHRKYAAIGLLAASLIALTGAAYLYLPIGQDWIASYRPATELMMQGISPYARRYIFVSPWTFLPLMPFALLPPQIDRAVLFTVSLLAFTYTAYRLKSKPLHLLFIIFSYPVLFSLLYGNLEWLISLGFVLPPQIGLFFVFIKPQFGAPIAVFWLIEAWRDGKIREVIRIFAPIILAFLASFVIFGFWPLLALKSDVVNEAYNTSLWPRSIPIGIALLVAAIRNRNLSLAMISSPFFSPYIAPQSWSLALLGLATMPLELFSVSIGIWMVRLISNQFLN